MQLIQPLTNLAMEEQIAMEYMNNCKDKGSIVSSNKEEAVIEGYNYLYASLYWLKALKFTSCIDCTANFELCYGNILFYNNFIFGKGLFIRNINFKNNYKPITIFTTIFDKCNLDNLELGLFVFRDNTAAFLNSFNFRTLLGMSFLNVNIKNNIFRLILRKYSTYRIGIYNFNKTNPIGIKEIYAICLSGDFGYIDAIIGFSIFTHLNLFHALLHLFYPLYCCSNDCGKFFLLGLNCSLL